MKPIGECSLEELEGSPMNLYLYAVTVIGGRLPPAQHTAMERLLRENPNEYVKGYFAFLSRRTMWGRIKGFFGV